MILASTLALLFFACTDDNPLSAGGGALPGDNGVEQADSASDGSTEDTADGASDATAVDAGEDADSG
jgi:hypothetical protein